MTNPPAKRAQAESNGGGWAQKALASCYFHTPLPSLMKPVRERYRITRSPESRWPNLGKRTGPSARILYFHRINDDRDPFFPAMSTGLFEREMKFLARYYKVVSLDQLVDHLDRRDPGTPLTITFDDGYQDNFMHAFPILQRYGLPATIFLTTGSIDTREPLWFEQLSLALKKTRRKNLEVDTLRFPIRTPDERLWCNHQIQNFLRSLPDLDRRRWLAQIRRSLAIESDEERRGKMLTWDQIRYMHSRGIDFGGHTISHPFLSRTTEEDASWEISGCKIRIEEELQRPVRYFAYPNGHEPDVSESNHKLVRRAGYRGAVTTTWGMNDSRTDRMKLKRGGPWETSPALFAYKLDWYQLTNG